MRRTLALSVLVGSVVAGVGCHHVAGKCDCTYDPADAIHPAPNNPYSPTQTFSGPVPPAPPKAGSPDAIPPGPDEAPAPKKAAPPSKISAPMSEPTAPVVGAISLPALPTPFGN